MGIRVSWASWMLKTRTVTLDPLVGGEKSTFLYEYDFGDSWEHELLVEQILPQEEGKRYPLCLTGKRACPPEDCRGIWGYVDFLETIRDPKHPEYEEMLAWVGGEFDPDASDLEEVTTELQRLTSPEGGGGAHLGHGSHGLPGSRHCAALNGGGFSIGTEASGPCGPSCRCARTSSALLENGADLCAPEVGITRDAYLRTVHPAHAW